MKKFLILLSLLGFLAFKSAAQTNDGPKFNIALEGGLPLGTSKQLFSSIIGASLKYEYPLADNVFVTASAGYSGWLIKHEYSDFDGAKSVYSFVPLKAGIKGYLQEGFFLEGQVGASIYAGSNGKSTSFIYSPGIGYTFDGGFEAGVRYEAWVKDGTASQVALRLGFRF